jgi:hypothetical protein
MMHEKSKARQEAQLRDCLPYSDRFAEALDRYADSLLRATEWDAMQWGFDPDKWMARERLTIAHRGGRDWPAEVI